VKEDHVIPEETLAKKKVRVINRDVVVFAFFLFLSFLFWYLNALRKEIETDISYAVKYTNIPKGRVLTEKQAIRLNLFLKGTGYQIIKSNFSDKKSPVIIDVSKANYRRVPGSKSLDYYILTSGLVKSLSSQLKSGCQVTSIKPDTLFITLEKASVIPD